MIYIKRNTPLILQFTYDGIYTLPLFHMYFICISSYQLVNHFHLVVASCCCHPNYFPACSISQLQNYFAVCCLLLAPTMLACNLNNEHDETTFLLPFFHHESIHATIRIMISHANKSIDPFHAPRNYFSSLHNLHNHNKSIDDPF